MTWPEEEKIDFPQAGQRAELLKEFTAIVNSLAWPRAIRDVSYALMYKMPAEQIFARMTDFWRDAP